MFFFINVPAELKLLRGTEEKLLSEVFWQARLKALQRIPKLALLDRQIVNSSVLITKLPYNNSSTMILINFY